MAKKCMFYCFFFQGDSLIIVLCYRTIRVFVHDSLEKLGLVLGSHCLAFNFVSCSLFINYLTAMSNLI